MKNLVCIVVFSLIFCSTAFSQFYMDPAQSYNLLDIQNNKGKYILIDNFKVIGTPYLFGGNKTSDIYAKGQFGGGVSMSYNTYLQSIEFSINGQSGLTKDLMEVDSFILKRDQEYYLDDLFFVNAALIGSKEKCFFQLVSDGKFFSLYKKYSSKLEIVSTNYVQSELRQFSLSTDFYFLDKKSKSVRKLKIGKKAIIKEFEKVKDLSEIVDKTNFDVDTENVVKTLFLILNT